MSLNGTAAVFDTNRAAVLAEPPFAHLRRVAETVDMAVRMVELEERLVDLRLRMVQMLLRCADTPRRRVFARRRLRRACEMHGDVILRLERERVEVGRELTARAQGIAG